MKKFLLLFVVILGIILIFSILILDKNSGMQHYPLKISIGQRFLAAVVQVFKTGSEKRIEVDLSQQKIKIFENGEMIDEFSVSTGKRETPTPAGKFKVYNKHLMIYSNIAQCWLPFWVGFTLDGLYGFHELPVCEQGRKGLEELGEPASIGCIRLGMKDAESFYKWVAIGTSVVVYGKEPLTWCYNLNTGKISRGNFKTVDINQKEWFCWNY